MSNLNRWEIESYLLGDPSINRQAFEQQMQNDWQLALKVGEVAEHLEAVARAAATSKSAELNPSLANGGALINNGGSPIESAKTSSNWQLWIAVAATVLLAVSIIWYGRTPRNQFEEVADHWLGLQFDQDLQVDSESDVISQRQRSISDSDDVAADDWLIEGAVAFYSDQET